MIGILQVLRGYRRGGVAAFLISAVGLGAAEVPRLRQLSMDAIVAFADFLSFSRSRAPTEAVLLTMDVPELGSPRNYATLVSVLAEARAAAIVFDIVFDTPAWSEPGAVAVFSNAVARAAVPDPHTDRHLKVVLAARADYQAESSGHPRSELPLANGLGDLETAFPRRVAVGLAHLQPDAHGVIRKHVTDPGYFHKSLAAAAVELIHGSKVPRSTNWIRFYGGAGALRSFAVTAIDPDSSAVDWNVADPEATLAGRVVFIGHGPSGGASSSIDMHPTPLSGSRTGLSSGVEIHATQYLNLVRKEHLNELSRAGEWCVLIPVGIIAGCAAARWPVLAVGRVAGIGVAAAFALGLIGFGASNMILPWLAIAGPQMGVMVAISLVPMRSAFVSFRYADGLSHAQLIASGLRARGVDAFLDVADDSAGKLERVLLPEIARRGNLVLVLTPMVLSLWKEGSDWIGREIQAARACGARIIPVPVDRFGAYAESFVEAQGPVPAPLGEILQEEKRAEFQGVFSEASVTALARKLRPVVRWR